MKFRVGDRVRVDRGTVGKRIDPRYTVTGRDIFTVSGSQIINGDECYSLGGVPAGVWLGSSLTLVQSVREPAASEPSKCEKCVAPGDSEKTSGLPDAVNHPKHYTSHPSGVECITVAEHMGFNMGNALKYIWRADHKNGVEDLRKAEWYIRREIERRSTTGSGAGSKKHE